MVLVPAGVRYTATDEVSDVVKRIASNEARAAESAARSVLAAEAKKGGARRQAIAALEAEGLKAEEIGSRIEKVANEIIAAEQRKAQEIEASSKAWAAAGEEAAEKAAAAGKAAAQAAADEQEKAAERFANAYLGIRSIVETIASVVQKVVGTLFEFASAAAEAEKVERRLSIILGLHGDETDRLVQSLTEYNTKIQETLGLDGDHLSQLQGTLALQGVANEELQKATEYTIGLAQVTGSLDSAARLVAKAYQGNFEALQRYGIAVKDGTAAEAKFAELHGVAAKQTDLLSTKMSALTARWGELKEEIGATDEVQTAANYQVKILDGSMQIFQDNLRSGRSVFVSAADAAANLGLAFFGINGPLNNNIRLIREHQKNLDEWAELGRRTVERIFSDAGFAKPTHISSLQVGDLFDPEAFDREVKKAEEAAKRAIEAQEARINALLEGWEKEADLEKEIEDQAIKRRQHYEQVQAQQTKEGAAYRIKLSQEASKRIADNELDGQQRRIKQEEDTAKRIAESQRDAVESAISAGQTIAQSAINAAASFSRAADIREEAEERIKNLHREVSQAQQIREDAEKQANAAQEAALKNLAGVAITETGKIVAESVRQILATGAATAAKAGQDAGAASGPAALAVVPGVIAAMTAIFAALATSFAKGGVVTGGTPGKDSVPALLMPNERVLTVDQNRAFEAMMGLHGPVNRSGHFANGGVVGRSVVPQAVTVNLAVSQLTPERDAAFRRTVNRTMIPAIGQGIRDGAPFSNPRSFGSAGNA